MGLLDELMILLSDGEWHKYHQIAPKVGATETKVNAALSLLARYEMIQYDDYKAIIRATPRTIRWLEELSIH